MTETRRIDPGEEFAYLGKKGVEFGGLDTFDRPTGVSLVRMTSDEVTSLCPITGQPDFEVVDLMYAPRQRCIESKALKLYLHSLRNTAGFTEALAGEIAATIAEACEPRWVRVDVTQKPRGGISIVGTSVLHRNSEGGYEVGEAFLPMSDFPRNFYLEH